MIIDGFTDAQDKAIYEGAKRACTVGRGVVEVRDLYQEAWLWIIENRDLVDEWKAEGDALSKLRKAAYNAGIAYVRAYMRQVGGTQKTDFAIYSTATVQDVLPAIFRGETLPVGQEVNEEVKHKQSPAEGGNGLVTVIDIKNAFMKLNDGQKQILYALYANPEATYDKVAVELDMSVTTLRRREQRALETIVDALGGPRIERRRRANGMR